MDTTQAGRYADQIMTAIDKDIADGIVPASVSSFSELHDHVDANMYVIQALGGDFGTPEHYGDEYEDGTTLSEADQALVDAEAAMANAVMDEVDRRLAARANPTWKVA